MRRSRLHIKSNFLYFRLDNVFLRKTTQSQALYAASKKSHKLTAHTYSHMRDLLTTGLRIY
ncbi:hypothetical protein TH15_01220 [Thalassospira profundimaris]|uniref:Integrase n=1 Tax=Thalassospira indica TaxID=1891279 RepID=A0ABN5NB32_9PROT|nr:hypothetical protein DY252_05020 [Thalassospira indica]OAZ14466.1 hypothetical protein TH15_01220 [Thalassospira profundimaris]